MQGRRGASFSDFGDPFAGFGSFGGFGGHRSLVSSVFGGRDPFDDPFFTQPFGGMFESSLFGSRGSPFIDMPGTGFLEHQVQQPNTRGPIIEELNSDDEKEEEEKKDNPRKHRRSSKEPYVEDADDEAAGRKSKQMQYRNEYNRMTNTQPQPQPRSFSFTSSTVTYGGTNGPYYTSSTTRRTGSDGLTFEESKEADTTTRQAAHRVSRGIRNKGHSVTRKLNSDGRVDTMQALHNLNENELSGFEEAWQGNAKKYLPGWNERFNGLDNIGHSSSGQTGQANRGGWALPSTERVMPSSSHSQHPRTEGEIGDRTGSSRGRARATTTRINID